MPDIKILPGLPRLHSSTVLLIVVAAMVTPTSAAAVTPTSDQTVDNGTIVSGLCTAPSVAVSGDSYTVTAEGWTLMTVDPARLRESDGGEKGTVAPDTSLLGNAGSTSGDGKLLELRPYDHATESFPYGVLDYAEPNLGVDRSKRWYVLEGLAQPTQSGPCGLVAQSDGDAAVSGTGIKVERPGPYTLEQWHLRIDGTKIDERQLPPASDVCAGDESFSAGMGYQGLYYSLPSPGQGKNWWTTTSCTTRTSSTPFFVRGAAGKCPVVGDMTGWPDSLYINQYDAGKKLGLPVREKAAGGNACGPSSLLMGMFSSYLARKHAFPKAPPEALGSDYGSALLTRAYDNAMVQQNASNAPPEQRNSLSGKNSADFLKRLGWTGYKAVQLGADAASTIDADPLDHENPDTLGANERAIDDALSRGPVVMSTAFSTRRWGRVGGGHVILIEGVSPDHPRDYIVDDPAGNYFGGPGGGYGPHYGPGKCGYHVLYPKAWVLAFTAGRWMLELGHPKKDPVVAMVSDAAAGTSQAPASFYVEDAQGRRTGWLDGAALTEIPDSDAMVGPQLASDPAAGDADADGGDDVGDGPPERFLLVPDPVSGLKLHIKGAAGGGFALAVDVGRGVDQLGHEELTGDTTGLDTVATSNVLASAPAAGDGSVGDPSAPGHPSAPSPPAADPLTKVTIPRQRLRRVMTHGLTITGVATIAATVRVRLRVTRRVAARFHVPVMLATRRVHVTPGRVRLVVRFSARARRALAHRHPALLAVGVSLASGTQTVSRHVVLRR